MANRASNIDALDEALIVCRGAVTIARKRLPLVLSNSWKIVALIEHRHRSLSAGQNLVIWAWDERFILISFHIKIGSISNRWQFGRSTRVLNVCPSSNWRFEHSSWSETISSSRNFAVSASSILTHEVEVIIFLEDISAVNWEPVLDDLSVVQTKRCVCALKVDLGRPPPPVDGFVLSHLLLDRHIALLPDRDLTKWCAGPAWELLQPAHLVISWQDSARLDWVLC